MNIKGLILTVLIIFSFVNLNSLGKFYMTEPAKRGQSFEFLVNVNNPTNHALDDVSVKLYIYDLGERLNSNSFDVKKKDTKLAAINWIIPKSMPPGTYLTKLSVGNDDYTNVKHFYLTVV